MPARELREILRSAGIEDFHNVPGARAHVDLRSVEQGEQTGRVGRCGLPRAYVLPSHKAGAIKMSDRYINELTGLEIPEHDRVALDFGRPSRDKRVGEVYCLFQNRGEKLLAVYRDEAAAMSAMMRHTSESTCIVPMPLVTNNEAF